MAAQSQRSLKFLAMLAKIRVVQVLPLNQPQNIPIGPTLIQYGSLKRKIVAVLFFLDASYFC